jgi:hypothetical protein
MNGRNKKPFEQERDQQRSEKGQNWQKKNGQKDGCESCKKNASYSNEEMNQKQGSCCNKNDYEDIDE